MKKRPKEPSTPLERHETIRQEIIAALSGKTLSAKDISVEIRISEKEVSGHLEHIQKTLNRREQHLVINPAECAKCGFVFRKREKLKRPGRCPLCKGEVIRDALFSIRTALSDREALT